MQEFINSVNETGLGDRSLLVRSFTRNPVIHLKRIKVMYYNMTGVHACVSMVTGTRLQNHICMVL